MLDWAETEGWEEAAEKAIVVVVIGEEFCCCSANWIGWGGGADGWPKIERSNFWACCWSAMAEAAATAVAGEFEPNVGWFCAVDEVEEEEIVDEAMDGPDGYEEEEEELQQEEGIILTGHVEDSFSWRSWIYIFGNIYYISKGIHYGFVSPQIHMIIIHKH
jgi:hypothetical protein